MRTLVLQLFGNIWWPLNLLFIYFPAHWNKQIKTESLMLKQCALISDCRNACNLEKDDAVQINNVVVHRELPPSQLYTNSGSESSVANLTHLILKLKKQDRISAAVIPQWRIVPFNILVTIPQKRAKMSTTKKKLTLHLIYFLSVSSTIPLLSLSTHCCISAPTPGGVPDKP